jgi:hypothetical protein
MIHISVSFSSLPNAMHEPTFLVHHCRHRPSPPPFPRSRRVPHNASRHRHRSAADRFSSSRKLFPCLPFFPDADGGLPLPLTSIARGWVQKLPRGEAQLMEPRPENLVYRSPLPSPSRRPSKGLSPPATFRCNPGARNLQNRFAALSSTS